MKKISGSIALAGIPLLFAFAAFFTPLAASADQDFHSGFDGFKVAWHHFCNWGGHGGNTGNSGKGALVVVKRTMGGNGTFSMTGDNGIGSFSVSTSHWHFGAKVLKNLSAGTYNITETVPSGWTQVSNTCTGVAVKAHHTAFCMVVNKYTGVVVEPPPTPGTGKLIVTKTIVGGTDGTFSFTGGGDAFADFTITTSGGTNTHEIDNLSTNTYTVVENPVPEGWDMTSTCTDVSVTNGQVATCTITNTAVPVTPAPQTGGLTIVKNAVGGAGDFTFNVTDVNNSTMTTEAVHAAVGAPGSEDIYGVAAGAFTITENAQGGWSNGAISCVDFLGGATTTIAANATTTCSVTNSVVTPVNNSGSQGGGGGGGGGSNGPISTGGGGGGGGGGWTFNFPQVLGASSTTLPDLPAGCNALLSKYMRKGKPNDTAEVKKLQQFLNEQLGLKLPLSGFFGPATDKGVRQFQLMHKPQVLTPWGITDPTGYVYKTTERWINLSYCSTLDIPMPELN